MLGARAGQLERAASATSWRAWPLPCGKTSAICQGSASTAKGSLGEGRAAVKLHGLFGKPGTDGHDAGIPFWNPGTEEVGRLDRGLAGKAA